MFDSKYIQESNTLVFKTSILNDYKGYVFCIDNGNKDKLTSFVKENQLELELEFLKKEKNFVILSEITEENEDFIDIVSYLYPTISNIYLKIHKLHKIIDVSIQYKKTNIGQHLLKFLGDDLPFTNGLLAVDENNAHCYFTKIDSHSIVAYIDKLNVERGEWALDEYTIDNKIKLDRETKKHIIEITQKIDLLKNSLQYLFIVPIIEEYLIKHQIYDKEKLSRIVINEKDYSIHLENYDNFEVKLSHLSKAIYLLFLNNPDGILLTDLICYKSELIDYYKNLSNRVEYDKMIQSIDKVIDINTNEIYVHLSRIKSMFYKNFQENIAKNYIVQGEKNKPKSIILDSHFIEWKSKFDDLF